MNRPFAWILSFFRPDDEALSPEATSQVQLHRLTTLLGVALILFFCPVYSTTNPGALDPAWGYFGMAGLFAGLFVVSYGSKHVVRNYVTWLWGLLYVSMIWAVVSATLNQFASDYVVGLFLAYAIITAIMGLGAQSIGPVLGFLASGFLLTAVGILIEGAPRTSPAVLLAGMATMAITEVVVIQGQLSTRKKLRRREERLRSITENVSDGIYRSTPDEGMVYVNQAFADIFGFESTDEVLQFDEPAALYADPEDRHRLRAISQEEGGFDTLEIELRRKDGTTFPALLSGTVVRDDDGEVIYYDGAVTDITEQRQRLREAQRRSDAMEAVSDGIAILDNEGRYTYVNQAHATVYGYEGPEPFLGATWEMCYDEEELQRFKEEVMPTLFEEGEWRGEATGLRADGTTFPQELTLTLLEDGGIVCVVRDITEQKEAEQALREERNRFETLFQNLPTPVAHVGTDPKGEAHVEAVNEAFEDVFGVEASAVKEAGIDELLVPRDKQEEATRITHRALGEETLRTEVRRKAADGLRDFRVQVAVRRREERPPEMYAIYTDITERKRRERQLRERERQLQQIRENVTDVVWMSSPDKGVMEFISEAYEDVWGRPTQELKEEPGSFVEAIHPEDRGRVRSALERQRTNPEAYDETYRVVRPDGEIRWVHDRASGVYDQEGQVERIVGVATDITEQKKRERALGDRQRKVESLYEATNQLLTTECPSEVANRVHEVLRKVFDYALTGINLVDGDLLVPESVTLEEGHEMPVVQALEVEGGSVAARAYRTGETVVLDDVAEVDNEVEYGDLRSVAGVPLGKHGTVVIGQVEASGFDPFDLRLLEILAAHTTVVLDGLDRMRALQKSEQRFRGVFENAAIGIGIVDDEGHLIDANPALQRMTGYDGDELRGIHFGELTHPEDIEIDQQYYEELVEGKRDRYQMEKRYVQKGGDVFWGRLTVSRHEGGEKGQVIGMVEDIDDQKRYEEQLREAKEEAERMNRLKSAFLANMSHEIRTPLTSIIGFAEAIGEEVESLEDCLESGKMDALGRFSSLIMHSGHRLMETLDAVLNLSKLEAGEMDLDAEPIDLAAAVEEAAELFSRQAEEAGVDLHVETDGGPFWGRADDGGLQIALSNLLSNAIKYTEADGQVWMRAYEEGDRTVLEVEDTGVGMDPDRVPELFEAFKQESEGVSRQYEGSGLGLAVTKQVVNQMDGAIEVETEKGEGTCFAVRLPRVAQEAVREG